ELNLSILSLVVRKLAHIFEFFVLSILLLYLLLEFTTFDKYKIGYTFLIALLVAIIDEVIQSYVPGRGSSVIDVLIDSIGISIGIGLVIVIIYIKHRNQK
ncbi:MAG TPA: VanZ family protein, partial [Bacilli bacterium]